MRAEFDVAVDPKLIRINTRYKNISHTPKPVKDAVKSIVETAEKYKQAHGIAIDRKARLRVEFYYTMNDLMADVDGPGKRALDAIAVGLGFIDGHVDQFYQERVYPVGEPMFRVIVETLDHHEPQPDPPVTKEDGWGIMPGSSYVEVYT